MFLYLEKFRDCGSDHQSFKAKINFPYTNGKTHPPKANDNKESMEKLDSLKYNLENLKYDCTKYQRRLDQ